MVLSMFGKVFARRIVTFVLALGVFLITIGMKIDLGALIKDWPALLGGLAAVILVKAVVEVFGWFTGVVNARHVDVCLKVVV